MKTKKFAAYIALLFISVSLCTYFVLSKKYVVPIMMYHHVDYTEKPQANWVSPERFEWHMAFLKKHNYHVISLDELIRATQNGERLPFKSVVITFDDGYADNYTHAFKTLKKYNFPVTIFLPSDLIGEEGYMTEGQVNELLAHGIQIGSHARVQVYLPKIPLDQQEDQIIESKKKLENKFGVPIKYFAYPIGGFSEHIKNTVKEAGYTGALTTNRGYDRFNKDVYELNRIRFSEKDNRVDYLLMKLSGYYNLARALKRPN